MEYRWKCVVCGAVITSNVPRERLYCGDRCLPCLEAAADRLTREITAARTEKERDSVYLLGMLSLGDADCLAEVTPPCAC